jgi:hypothetical protein
MASATVLLGTPSSDPILTYVCPSIRSSMICASLVTRIMCSALVVDLLGPDPLARDGSPLGVVVMRAVYVLRRKAFADLPHVELDEAAALLVLIASRDPERFDAAAVRFLGARVPGAVIHHAHGRPALGGMLGPARASGMLSHARTSPGLCAG